MHFAEKAIRKRISEITIDHIAYVKQDIQRDIKYLFWQGIIDGRKYDKLNELLNNHCNEVLEVYFNRVYNSYIEHLDRIIHSLK